MGWTLLVVGLFLLIRLLGRLSGGDQRRPLSRPRMAETNQTRPSDHLNEEYRTDFTVEKPQEEMKPHTEPAPVSAVLPPRVVPRRMRPKPTKKKSPMQWAKEDWSRAVLMQEILGPPRASRPFSRKFPRGG